jgi:hypothetical protein
MERKDGEIETQKNKKKTIFAHSGMWEREREREH